MPWKREIPMDQKMMLIGDWLGGDFSKSELARYYGVSQPTVHKWISRYVQEGNKGLEERSRAPLSCPHQTGNQITIGQRNQRQLTC
ncbi:MAG: leucine zipper domain-containing protein [Candidatus Thiodiazotropha sp. 6PLUC5]